jgi:hypothetical protein
LGASKPFEVEKGKQNKRQANAEGMPDTSLFRYQT